jgi:DNA-directed RNA polymerase specialized sigma24 family protein
LLRDAAAPSPEEEVIRGQMAQEVERAMAPLTERER